MMEQLGIKALRPGPSGNDAAPNHANYDETKANPFPKLPDVLTLNNGKRVTTPAVWKQRRAEIVEDFEREPQLVADPGEPRCRTGQLIGHSPPDHSQRRPRGPRVLIGQQW